MLSALFLRWAVPDHRDGYVATTLVSSPQKVGMLTDLCLFIRHLGGAVGQLEVTDPHGTLAVGAEKREIADGDAVGLYGNSWHRFRALQCSSVAGSDGFEIRFTGELERVYLNRERIVRPRDRNPAAVVLSYASYGVSALLAWLGALPLLKGLWMRAGGE